LKSGWLKGRSKEVLGKRTGSSKRSELNTVAKWSADILVRQVRSALILIATAGTKRKSRMHFRASGLLSLIK
jgi:hypothetical protein